MEMSRFDKGVQIARDLVEQSLASGTEPFLTPERFEHDLRQIGLQLMTKISGLPFDALVQLYPVALLLRGYQVTSRKESEDLCLWEINYSDPGAVLHTGVAVLVRPTADPVNYEALTHQQGYSFRLLCVLTEVPSSIDVVPAEWQTMTLLDVTNLLMAVAVMQYLDNFVLTISNLPGFRQRASVALDALRKERQLTWESITAISQRWTSIAHVPGV